MNNKFDMNNLPDEEDDDEPPRPPPPATPPPPPPIVVSNPNNRTLITAANLAAALAASSGTPPKRSRFLNEPDLIIGGGGNNFPGGRKPATRPDPLAPQITQPCTECGRKFWSWKALFGHMRCHPERNWRGINPPPNFNLAAADNQATVQNPISSDDRDAASSLLALAGTGNEDQTNANTNANATADAVATTTTPPVSGNAGRFVCSSCDKVFGSHQALGGHRASHKNVKGCFAMNKSASENPASDDVVEEEKKTDEERNLHGNDNDRREVVLHGDRVGAILHGNEAAMMTSAGREAEIGSGGGSSRMHDYQCGICSKVFSSGQALGGHKRCHWERDASVEMMTSQFEGMNRGNNNVEEDNEMIDLNLPPPPSAHPSAGDDGGASAPAPAPSSEDDDGDSSADMNLDLNLGL